MHNKFWLLFASLSILLSPLGAQQPPPASDPLSELLFPPELVMARQNALSLSDAQKTYVRGEILKVQTRFTELQWHLQDAMEGLIGLLKQSKADEAQVSMQLDKVLALERDIKRAQIALLVRIKNSLTAEQQHRLQALRGEAK